MKFSTLVLLVAAVATSNAHMLRQKAVDQLENEEATTEDVEATVETA